LTTYPRAFPQIVRMATGYLPDDDRFTAAWEGLLRRVGGMLEEASKGRVTDGPSGSSG
jgi:hypothetical protein